MGVWYEIQCGVTCDTCGVSECSSIYTMKELKAYLRRREWKIGKVTLCPDCRSVRERGKGEVGPR